VKSKDTDYQSINQSRS